jgi:CubicO group peptidase (beta-lactamase class C family)
MLGLPVVAWLGPTSPVGVRKAEVSGERLDAVLQGYSEREEFAGTALVTRGGETLLRAGYGLANRETGEANTPELGYQIASLTKGFTALACVQLEEAGALSLDDPITEYLPEVVHGEREGVPITIRHLLAHTAGVPDFLGFYDVYNPFSYPESREALIADIVERELEFTPGTEFRYGNSGYIYAGLIVERVARRSFEEYLNAEIFGPAGMTQTFLEEPPPDAPSLAAGYGVVAGQVIATSVFGRVDLAWAAGGITSTVDDMLRWHEALLTGKLASQAAIAAMYSEALDGSEYGLGWETVEVAGGRAVGHTGQTIGYAAQLHRFLGEGVVIVLLSNLQDAPVRAIGDELAGIVLAA